MFWWILVISFSASSGLILRDIVKAFGNLGINIISWKGHYHESHYQHSISNGIGSSFFFFFFWKIEHLYPIHLNIFFIYIYIYFFSVIQHQYHFDEIIHFSTISHSFIQGINSVLFNDWTFGSTCLRAFQEN